MTIIDDKKNKLLDYSGRPWKLEDSMEIPDKEFWRKQIKCNYGCPINTDARGYVRAIANGDYELAYLIARGPNPLGSICGRVCGAPCETACRRGDVDEPISIRALKRFVCDQYGPESRDDGGKGLIEFLKNAARKYAPRQYEDTQELLPLLQAVSIGSIPTIKNKSVGIIGSGCAGLSAAHDLALLGADVTIYEMEPVLSGLLAIGVPQYRLPRDLIQSEVDVILEMGVKAITNCQVGKDITFSELREKHDAVVIAVGLKKSARLPLEGVDAPNVYGGVEFLRDVALGNAPPIGRRGSRAIVIGGGSVSYDVSRTTMRQLEMDTARTALREPGIAEVHHCCLESLEEMPAEDMEIIEGEEEGVIRHNRVGPNRIIKDVHGNVTGVEFKKCTSVFNDEGRFSPTFDEDDKFIIECDNLFIAIGQAVDLSFVDGEKEGLEVTERGYIKCDPVTGKTSAPDIYVSGDLAYGPKLIIHAIASGKNAAREIYRQFTGNEITFEDTELHLGIADYEREPGYEHRERQEFETAPVEVRLKSHGETVDLGFTEEQALLEAGRCLDCGVNPIIDGDLCILCGGCVDVCPELCFEIVSVDRLPREHGMGEIIDAQLDGMPAEAASAIIMDTTSCIRCASCAERCPTGAITMEKFIYKECPSCQSDSLRKKLNDATS
jgi:NADPH-dependent glutamate synthase beta subunit-like oxidoreductase